MCSSSGGCRGDTPQEQAKSAATIATVLSSRPGAPQPVAFEANFEQEKFKVHYRVWCRLPDLALGDKASKEFRATTSGANCGTFGGEASAFGNSLPAELKRDDEYRIGYFLVRGPDGRDIAWADFVWYHPHPPCGNTPDHKDATIKITLTNPSGSITCTYVGAATGKGECKDGK